MSMSSGTPVKSATPVRPVYDALSQRHIIEQDKRLSESALWTLQAQYYNEQGIEAFQQVPSFGTGNATIGRVYAELILGALIDLKDRLIPDEPIYILELGGGSGRLAQHILNHLQRSKTQFPLLEQVCYILSDASAHTLEFWEQNPSFEPLTSAGKLDFAVFDPLTQTSLTTQLQRQEIRSESLKNPLIVVATYFFDTIAHDAFYIENHQPQEVLVSLTRDAKKYSLDTPVAVSQLQLKERRKPTKLPYYHHTVLDDMLASYCQELENASIVLPTQGIHVLDNLQQLTSNEIVLITSDKGYGNPALEPTDKAMNMAIHGDAFSMCVNFDALTRYVEHYHGCSLFSRSPAPGLKTFMGILPKRGGAIEAPQLPMTRYWFQTNVVDLDVMNQALNIYPLYASDYEINLNARFDVFTALVTLSHYEPGVFARAFESIRAIDHFSLEQTATLTYLLAQVERNIVGNTAQEDVFFELLLLYKKMNMVERAHQTYDTAVRLTGVQYNLAFFMGAMYQDLAQPQNALPLYQQAHEALAADTSPESQAMAQQIAGVIQQLQQALNA